MESTETNAILVHIEHSKPIEINEFTATLNAIGELFTSFAQAKADTKELAQAKLYVDKIEDGCIDVILSDIVSSWFLPFVENMNIILAFSLYAKDIIDYFTKGIGKKPELATQELKQLKDVFSVTARDNNGTMSIGAINKSDKSNVYNYCTINYIQSNSAQKQIENDIELIKKEDPIDDFYSRQLMTIYQLRSDMGSDIGNKAIIESISKKKIAVVFETDKLKNEILNNEYNPTKKAFLVDVVVQTICSRLAAYKVMALHEIIDIDD